MYTANMALQSELNKEFSTGSQYSRTERTTFLLHWTSVKSSGWQLPRMGHFLKTRTYIRLIDKVDTILFINHHHLCACPADKKQKHDNHVFFESYFFHNSIITLCLSVLTATNCPKIRLLGAIGRLLDIMSTLPFCSTQCTTKWQC